VRTPDTQRASGKRRGWLFLILGSALDEYGPRPPTKERQFKFLKKNSCVPRKFTKVHNSIFELLDTPGKLRRELHNRIVYGNPTLGMLVVKLVEL